MLFDKVWSVTMPCYFPLRAWRSAEWIPDGGKHPLTFDPSKGIKSTEVLLPCGKCVGCRLIRSREWAIRCVHEAKAHAHNCYLTLTYNDESLPVGSSLDKDNFTNFVKRFRKFVYPTKIRYFQCGEYGENFLRPHHHMIVFGYDFPDKVLHTKSDFPLYTSEILEKKLWQQGFCLIGEVTFDSAAYVARYIFKKRLGDESDQYSVHYAGRVPEYITMSRKPGLGKLFFDKFSSDIYNYDKLVESDKKFVMRPPRYYDNKYEEIESERMDVIKQTRRLKVVNREEDSIERAMQRAEHADLIRQRLLRKYEGA